MSGMTFGVGICGRHTEVPLRHTGWSLWSLPFCFCPTPGGIDKQFLLYFLRWAFWKGSWKIREPSWVPLVSHFLIDIIGLGQSLLLCCAVLCERWMQWGRGIFAVNDVMLVIWTMFSSTHHVEMSGLFLPRGRHEIITLHHKQKTALKWCTAV